LRKMQEYADYVLPIMEVEMLTALNNHEMKYFGRQLLITDPANAKLQYKSHTVRRARYTTYAPMKQTILHRVNAARRGMEYLKNEMEVLSNTEDKEKFLMRHFVIDNLDGFRRNLAARYMLGEGRYQSPHWRSFYQARKYVSAVCLVLMWAFLIYYILVFNLSIGSRATTLWTALTMASIALDALLFQPLRIWFKWIVVNSWVAKDVRTILESLGKRYTGIIQRKAGIMRDANNLVQHFNPACRTARQFPHLPISRFLLSINDYDVPHYTNTAMPMKLKRGWAWWWALALLIVTTFLTVTTAVVAPLGDLAGDLVIVSATEVVMIVIYFISEGSPIIGILIAFGIVSLPFAREWYLGIQARRKRRRLEKKMQDDDFLKYHLGGGERQKAGVTKDEYLRDEYLGGGQIDNTAQFKSKFKPVKGEIKDKYKPDSNSVVPAGDDVVLFNQGLEGPLGVGSQVMSQDGGAGAAGLGPNTSFGGLQMTSDYGSGVAPATWEYQQAQQPLSAAVKKYGGGGAFGSSRPLQPLPPIGDRPPNQEQVAAQIAQLEKNITLNLENIIRESIDKSSLHAKRKAARRKQVRASGRNGGRVAPVNTDGDAGDREDDDYASVKIRTPRSRRPGSSRKKKGASPVEEGPGLSARGKNKDPRSPQSSKKANLNLLDANNEDVDYLKGFQSSASEDDASRGITTISKRMRGPNQGIGGADKYQGGEDPSGKIMKGVYDQIDRDEEVGDEPSVKRAQGGGESLDGDGDDDDSSGSDIKGYVSPEQRHSNKMLGRREKQKPHAGLLEEGGHPAHRVPPGGRLKPIEMDTAKPKFGENPDLIEIKKKVKPTTVVDVQFPSWH
jgi:hypothetical protein